MFELEPLRHKTGAASEKLRKALYLSRSQNAGLGETEAAIHSIVDVQPLSQASPKPVRLIRACAQAPYGAL